MSMIEKVARALASEHILDWAGGDDAAWVDANWRWHTRPARAAIEAMEPTEAMAEAFSNYWNLHCGEGAPPTLIRDALAAAMHAAALEGEG